MPESVWLRSRKDPVRPDGIRERSVLVACGSNVRRLHAVASSHLAEHQAEGKRDEAGLEQTLRGRQDVQTDVAIADVRESYAAGFVPKPFHAGEPRDRPAIEPRRHAIGFRLVAGAARLKEVGDHEPPARSKHAKRFAEE